VPSGRREKVEATDRAKYVGPGEGNSVWVVGLLITVKVASEDTGGAFSLIETIEPAQGGPPPHLHHNVEEMMYVLEGEVEFVVGERTIRAGAGSCAYLPRGIPHTYKNIGTSPSRTLAVITPGGFEKFFVEVGEPATEGDSPPEGEPDVGRIVQVGQKYGVEFLPPPG
jgi:mannose-6-phosphate isomerase-like protein (cupin superfamily)